MILYGISVALIMFFSYVLFNVYDKNHPKDQFDKYNEKECILIFIIPLLSLMWPITIIVGFLMVSVWVIYKLSCLVSEQVWKYIKLWELNEEPIK
jgi:hypothetical protein